METYGIPSYAIEFEKETEKAYKVKLTYGGFMLPWNERAPISTISIWVPKKCLFDHGKGGYDIPRWVVDNYIYKGTGSKWLALKQQLNKRGYFGSEKGVTPVKFV